MSLTPNDTNLEELEDASGVCTNLEEEFSNTNGEVIENGFDVPESMPIYVRVRALLPAEILKGYSECFVVVDENTVRSVAPSEGEKRYGQEPIQDFTFSRAFGPDLHQFILFENTMKDAVQNFIEGQNSLIFAYGNSGSGKTYTMHGTPSEPGIIPLTVQLLFDCLKGRQVDRPCFKPMKSCDVTNVDQNSFESDAGTKSSLLALAEHDDYSKLMNISMCNIFDDAGRSSSFVQSEDRSIYEASQRMKSLCQNSVVLQGSVYYAVWCSFVEIYNEKIYDLLQPAKRKRPRLILGKDTSGNTYVKDVKEICVNSSDEVFKLLAIGRKNLKIASTKLNYQSSRSHCIFTVKLVRMADQNNPSSVGINLLSFCDLAGSERHSRTQNDGDRLKEAGNINNSLMVLRKCLEVLRFNQTQKDKRMVVPFRESQLTRLFEDFFSGRGKASMIVNISPSSLTYNETMNVLKFSALAKQVIVNDTLSTTTVQQIVNGWQQLSFRENSALESEGGDISYADLDNTMSLTQEIEEKDKMIKELIDIAKELEAKLEQEKKDRLKFEMELRSKLRKDFAEIIERREQERNKLLDKYKEMYRLQSEKRWMQLAQALKANRALSDGESDEETDIDSNSDDDEDDDDAADGGRERVVSNAKRSRPEIAVPDEPQPSTSGQKPMQLLSEPVDEEANMEEISKNQEIEELKAKLKKALEDQEESLGERDAIIDQLNEQLDTLNRELVEASKNINTMEIQLKEKEYKNMEEVRGYSDEINELNQKVSDLEEIIKMKDMEIEEKEKELQTSLTKEACQAAKIEELINTASHLQQKLIPANKRVLDLEKESVQYAFLERENRKLRKAVAELEAENRKLWDLEVNNTAIMKSLELTKKDKRTRHSHAARCSTGDDGPSGDDSDGQSSDGSSSSNRGGRRRRQSVPWRAKFDTDDFKNAKKEDLWSMLTIVQIAENSSFTRALTFHRENKVLKERLLGAIEKMQNNEIELKRITCELKNQEEELETRALELTNLGTELQNKDTELKQKDIELENRDEELKRKNLELENLTAELENISAELKRKNLEVKNLATELKHKNSEVKNLTTELESKNSEVENLSAELKSKNSEAENLTTELGSKNLEVENLTAELKRKDLELENQSAELKNKDLELEKQGAELKRKDSLLEAERKEPELESKEPKNPELESKVSENPELESMESKLESKDIEKHESKEAAVNTSLSSFDVSAVKEALEKLVTFMESAEDIVRRRHSSLAAGKLRKRSSIDETSKSFTEQKTADGKDSGDIAYILGLVKAVESISSTRIQQVLRSLEACCEEIQELSELNQHLKRELNEEHAALCIARENHRKQMLALKENCDLKMKALFSRPTVVLLKDDVRIANYQKSVMHSEKPATSRAVIQPKQKSQPEDAEEKVGVFCLPEPSHVSPQKQDDPLIDSAEKENVSNDQPPAVAPEVEEVPNEYVTRRGRMRKAPVKAKANVEKSKKEQLSKGRNAGEQKGPPKGKNMTSEDVREEPVKAAPEGGRNLRPRRGASAAADKATARTMKRKAVKEPEARQPASPIDRVRDFVNEATSRIKAATVSYLTPLKAVTPEPTPVLNKKRKKLYQPEEPVLSVPSNPENKKPPNFNSENTPKVLIQQINARRQRR